MDPVARHILVDFENVCEVDPTLLQNRSVNLTLLLGEGQKKLDVVLVQELILHAGSVHLVRLGSRGKNAVDFALAYYLGQAVAAAPRAAFHIVSKDAGFDPLIEHLVSKNIRIARHADFSGIMDSKSASPAPDPAQKTSPRTRGATPEAGVSMEQVLAQLRKAPASRPKSRKSLLSYLSAHHGPGMTETNAAKLADRLCQTGSIAIDAKGAVTYHLEAQ